MANKGRHNYDRYNRGSYSGSRYIYSGNAVTRKKKRGKTILIVSVVLVFLLSAAFAAFYMLNGMSLFFKGESEIGSSETTINTFIDSSEIKHISFNGEKYESRSESGESYMISYPLTNIKTIDSQIAEKVKYFEKCAVSSDARFTSYDYTTEIADNTYLSVIFRSAEYNDNKEKFGEDVFTMAFNLKKGSSLKNEDVFKKDFYSFASEYVRKYFKNNLDTKANVDNETFVSATTADELHFDQFSFNDKQCTLYFNEKKLFASGTKIYDVSISLPKIADYLKISLSGAESEKSDTSGDPYISPTIRDNLNPDKPMIALTFDDGPHYSNTERILNTLENYGSRATFFVIGQNAAAYPEILKEISDAGCQIGNHSNDHVNLTEQSDKKIKEQASLVDEAVKKATGSETTAFRPPYGSYNEKVQKILNKTPLIFWDVDTEDWELRDKKKVIDSVMKQAGDGEIILLHDIYDSTAEAAEEFIPKLIQKGYQLVTVEELLYYKNIEVNGGETYPW